MVRLLEWFENDDAVAADGDDDADKIDAKHDDRLVSDMKNDGYCPLDFA